MLRRLRSSRRGSILGINRRNLEYVFARNPRERFPRVDDKIRAKHLLAAAGLPFPEVLEIVRARGGIGPGLERLDAHDSFVVKPSRGFGGNGVWVVGRGPEGAWTRAGGAVDREQLAFHMASILSGMFSLDQLASEVLVEARVYESEQLGQLHGCGGVCDIRVIVSEGRPVMAMLRLPCIASEGLANLHAGGIGVGIELRGGKTTSAIRDGRPTECHPDTGLRLAGHSIPGWDEILRIVTPLNDVFGMGFLGADVVVDRHRGPLVLEVNARPGLAIQLANRAGLRDALAEREGPESRRPPEEV